MIELESRNFDTHEYLKSVREMRNTEYKRYFEEYEQKYSIDDFEAWSERQQEKAKMKALLEEQQLQQGRKSKNVEMCNLLGSFGLTIRICHLHRQNRCCQCFRRRCCHC